MNHQHRWLATFGLSLALIFPFGCTGGSGGGGGGVGTGPFQTGGAEGNPCTPGFHTVGCLVGGNARMECDGASSVWKLAEQCAAGTTCVETSDATGTRTTACQAAVVDAGTTDGAASSSGGTSGGTSGATSGGTSGGTSGADAGSTQDAATSSSSGASQDVGGSSGGVLDVSGSSSGTTSSSGNSSSSGSETDAGSVQDSGPIDTGSSSGTTSSGGSSSSGADASDSSKGPADIANPNVNQTPTPNIAPATVNCPSDGTAQTSKVGNVTVDFKVKVIDGVSKLHGALTWKTDTATIRQMCLSANKLVGKLEAWDSTTGGKVAETNFDGFGKLHGPNIGFHENGKKSYEGMYNGGVQVGFVTQYNDQGIQTLNAWFDNAGKLGGKYESWHDNGQLEIRQYYVNGELQGVRDGWHGGGSKSFIGAYDGGLEEGWHTWWGVNGAVVGQTNYTKGNGAILLKHDNGKVSLEGAVVNGKPHGKWTWYDENGAKTQEVEYTLGSGAGSVFYPDGTKAIQLSLKDGSRHGYWKYWNSQGQLEREGEYKEGSMINTWIYYDAGVESYKLCFIDGYATVTDGCQASWLM